MGEIPGQTEDIFTPDSTGDITESPLETPMENIYNGIHNRSVELIQAEVDCQLSAEGTERIASGVCEHHAVDVVKRDQTSIIKLSGRSLIDGIDLRVLDPSTGFSAVIQTVCLNEGECPDGLTSQDRSIKIGEAIKLVPHNAISLFIETSEHGTVETTDEPNEVNVNVYILEGIEGADGQGGVEVLVNGQSIGKIYSPGIDKQNPLPMNMGTIKVHGQIIDSIATISPDGKIIVKPESKEVIEEMEGGEEFSKNTTILTDEKTDGCNLNKLLTDTQNLNPTESILVFIALMAIIQKLKK